MGGSASTQAEEEDEQAKELTKEKDNPDNKKMEADADTFKGPSDESKRKTTDIICLLMIMAAWFSMTIVGFVVCGVIPSEDLPAGNPAKLTHAMDYKGKICGVDDAVANKENAYYLKSGEVVCVKECPSQTILDLTPGSLICAYDVQDDLDLLCSKRDYDSNSCSAVSLPLYFSKAATMVQDESCMPKIKSVVGPWYQCFWDLSGENSTALGDFGDLPSMDDGGGFEGFMADAYRAMIIVLVFGYFVAMAMGFVSLRILRVPGFLDLLVWGCIVGVFALLFGIGGMLFATGAAWAEEEPQTHSAGEIGAAKGFGYFFMGCGGVWALCILCSVKRILLAMGITKESAKALGSMTFLAMFPVFQNAAMIAFSCVWFVYMVYLGTSGQTVKVTITENTCDSYCAYSGNACCDDLSCDINGVGCMDYNRTAKEFVWSENSTKAYWYLLFCYFWTTEFIMAIGQLVVAMSVCFWYFERDKSKIGSSTVLRAIRTTFRYHLGSAAFGSLIIAIIKTIRAVIAKFQKDADKLSKRGGRAAAALAKAILCALQCCMWCIEKCAKFLNKHAYIQIAIFSYSFCKAARKAFFLILRNLLLIGAVKIVSDFVLTLLLIMIPVSTTFLAYCFLVSDAFDTKIASPIAPVIFIFICSYYTAKKFTETFGMVISTILQCYVADTEMFPPEKRFAGGSLKAAVKSSNDKARKDATGAKVAPAPAPVTEPAEEAKPVEG